MLTLRLFLGQLVDLLFCGRVSEWNEAEATCGVCLFMRCVPSVGRLVNLLVSLLGDTDESTKLGDHARALIAARQEVQRTALVNLDALVLRHELVHWLTFALSVLVPQVVRDLEDGSGAGRGCLDLLSGVACRCLGIRRRSGDVGVGQEHLADLPAGLLGLDGLAWWVSLLQDGREHGLDGAHGVFGRHGIRHVLGAALGVVHGGKDQVGDDLEVEGDGGRGGEHLGVGLSSLAGVRLGSGLGEVGVGLGGGVELEHAVRVLAVLALLLDDVGHELRHGLGGRVSAIREGLPRCLEEGACHGGLQSLQVTFAHDRLDDINGTGINESLARDRPLGQVEDDEEGEVLEAVGGPAGWRGGGGTDVLDDALGDLGLSDQGGVVLALGKVLDEATCPSDALGLAGACLGGSWRVGQELLKDAEQGLGVLERWEVLASVGAWGMLQDGGDAGLQEGQVHQADAAQVGFLLVLGDDLAESSDHLLGGWPERHDALVLGRDGQVVQREAGKVASVSGFLGQALGERGEDVVLSGTHHGDTVLLVADVAKLVDLLGGGGALLALGAEHGVDEVRDVIERRWLVGGALGGWGLFLLWSGLLLGLWLRLGLVLLLLASE
mmetsp:Transcript_15014/g.42411  ORF Transcript_15014/g.42411 Transcript_15014/m.42411 type:complete len:609 (-) Transcript_15014:121-1947(-)